MGFILTLLTVSVIIGIIVYLAENCDCVPGIAGFLVSSFCSLILCFLIWGASYYSYLDSRTFYDATREQYFESVEMYHDYAVLDLKGAAAIAFTDYKYQDYQKNISTFIRDLRYKIVKYNEEIISKRLMKKNWFFSWLIIAPDSDMKVVRMSKGEYNES